MPVRLKQIRAYRRPIRAAVSCVSTDPRVLENRHLLINIYGGHKAVFVHFHIQTEL